MKDKRKLQGVGLAVLATIIWSGNFIAARGIYKEIPPVSVSFYRWGLATVILIPFAWSAFRRDWHIIRKNLHYFFWLSLFGISLFNTFVYIAAHYTSAINLALIGTTSSPVMANIMARIFLKEKLGWAKIIGMSLCLIGVLFLLVRGDFQQLRHLQFSEGDLWVLIAAFSFAVYNILVRKKPAAISPISFLFTSFLLGSLLLVPFYIRELLVYPAVQWNAHLFGTIIYLSVGASVICFLIWNIAIQRLGAGRTSIFGNLIPVFSSLEAVWILNEVIELTHVISAVLVLTGLIIANWSLFKPERQELIK